MLFLINSISFGQDNCFPLYFEDAVGNKDTVWFGEAPSATFWLDEQLGEVNLLGEQIDSVFEVFFTDAVTGGMYYDTERDFDCYLELDQSPTFITKKQFNNSKKGLYTWFELGMIAKNWPVTISWDIDELAGYKSELECSICELYLYSWSPPVSLLGDVHCVGSWPNDYTLLNETSQVIVDSKHFGHYSSPVVSLDSINLFFLYYSYFTYINTIGFDKISCSFFSDINVLEISSTSDISLNSIEIFDVFGKQHGCYEVENNLVHNHRIEVGSLIKGIYIVMISSSGEKPFRKTQKILIK